MAITQDIYQSFDKGYKVRSVPLDISKAFDQVWHEYLIFKLKQNGILSNLVSLIIDFEKQKAKGSFKWSISFMG